MNITTNGKLTKWQPKAEQEDERSSREFVADVLDAIALITPSKLILAIVGAVIAFGTLCLALGYLHVTH